MGIFDFLTGGGSAPKGNPEAAIKKYGARAINKRAQAPDRWDAIQALSGLRTAGVVEALLPRFTFYVDPSITDQEEKDLAFQIVVDVGEPAIEPIVAFMRRAESVSWAIKMLDQIAGEERVISELVALLETMDTEYARDPEKKLQVISALEERDDARIVAAVTRFVEDVNESVRFNAAATIFAQKDAESARPVILAQLANEDSVRVKARMLDGFAARGWTLDESSASTITKSLPPGITVDAKGVVKSARNQA